MNLKIYIFLIAAILGGMLLPSCKTYKPAVNNGGFDFKVKADPSEVEVYFNELFYEGFKAMEVENNDDKAINNFKQCLSINPKSSATLYNLAQIYFRNKRINEAEELMVKAVGLDNTNKWYLGFLGNIYSAERSFSKAINTYEKLISLYPSDIDAYYDLANAYIYSRQPLKAVKVLDKLEEYTGITKELTEQKKKIYLSVNKVDKAASEIEKLIKSDPRETEYLKMLIDLYLANNMENKVIPLYEKILEIDSTDTRSQLVMADYYFRNNNKEKGLALAYKGFSNPDYDIEDKISFIYYNFLFKKDSANVNTVLKLADILVNIHPENPRAYAFRGDVLNELGKKDEALRDYHKALQFEKSIILLWKKVILIEYDNRNYAECASVAKEALEYFPNDPELYFYLGVVYNQLKNYQSAISTLEKGLDWVVGNDAMKGQYYSYLAEAYNAIKDYKNSDLNFEKALKSDSLNSTSLNNYAYYLSLRKERLDTAEIMSRKSLKFEPDNAAFLDTYGWILYLKGNFEEAEKYVSQALKKKPNDSDVLEHYGDILFKLGKTDDAVVYWEKASKNGAKSENLDRKIKDRKLYE